MVTVAPHSTVYNGFYNQKASGSSKLEYELNFWQVNSISKPILATRQVCETANIVVAVFNCAKGETFEHLHQFVKNINERAQTAPFILLVGIVPKDLFERKL